MSEPLVSHPSNPAQTFEDFYVPCMFRPWATDLLSIANPKIGERILDLACGTGIVARVAAQSLKGEAKLTGLDYSPAMLNVARTVSRHEELEIELVAGNAESLPFPDGAFDLVLVQQGLQFFADKEKALREMYRILAQAGRVVSSTWTGIENQPFNEVFANEIRRHLGISSPSSAFSLGDRGALESLFNGAGFSSVDISIVQRDVCYPSPDQFVEHGVASASMAVPELGTMNEFERQELVEAIRNDMEAAIRKYTVDGQLVAPTQAHIVLASKEQGEATR